MGLAPESARMRALRSYQVLDAPPDPRLDELARAAASVCSTPVALVSLVDTDRQFFMARVGLDVAETPRKGSFCSHAIEQAELFLVPDTASDRRFRAHPLVTGEPHIRFYGAAPLITSAREALGTLCVLDSSPRKLEPPPQEMLQILSHQVVGVLEERRKELGRAQVREALERDLRQQLGSIARHAASLHGPPKDLMAVLLAANSALETVDDAADLLEAEQGLVLRRRSADLAVVCRELVANYQQPGRPRVFFSATGDCRGFWDLDRLTHVLATLIERADEGPVRVSVRGLRHSVVVAIRAPSLARSEPALRASAVQQIVQAHGGELEAARENGEFSLALCLPRAQH